MTNNVASPTTELLGSPAPDVLTEEALQFVAMLHDRFNDSRLELLAMRERRRERIAAGERLTFLSTTADVRRQEWQIAKIPPDLQDRRVEITGPVDRKMMINALNSGAKAFMADFEDSLAPTWENVVDGQRNLADAARGTIELTDERGKEYRLNPTTATLIVRPRGWHMEEKHLLVDGRRVSASLFDFGLAFFHNAKALLDRGSGPYFYLPKMESHLEARLWNDVFVAAQEALGVPRGSIKATVLIETLPAAFEMDEILYELRDHAAGLNAGRWDYLFSVIKTFSATPGFVLPDRSALTMTSTFMRAYTDLLVNTCHRRGAHAMGGMSAFIPSRRDSEVNSKALEQVRADKRREASDGFDGTWIAHPDLLGPAREPFDEAFGSNPHQKVLRYDARHVSAAELLDIEGQGSTVTDDGVRSNVAVSIRYLESWIRGTGAVAIFNLMEDAATAEISRSQLWNWIQNDVTTESGAQVTPELVTRLIEEETERAKSEGVGGGPDSEAWTLAADFLREIVLADELVEFVTLPAYERFM